MIPSLSDIKKKVNPGYKVGADYIDMGRELDYDTVFDCFMDSYSIYYNLTRHDDSLADNTFAAEAVFDSKGEQYFLIKAAKVAQVNTAEYVYFVKEDELTADALKAYDIKAWTEGIAHVNPCPEHKNTDVVLIIIAKSITGEAKECVKKLSHSKNYKMALYGYSNYRLVAVETESGIVYFNRRARILKGLVGNILKEEKERGK
jgi:hypothetical protein